MTKANPEIETLEQFRHELKERASEDDIEIYLVTRNSSIGVECSDMKATGLRLWLENNGAEVVHNPGNGYLRVVPEGYDGE